MTSTFGTMTTFLTPWASINDHGQCCSLLHHKPVINCLLTLAMLMPHTRLLNIIFKRFLWWYNWYSDWY